MTRIEKEVRRIVKEGIGYRGYIHMYTEYNNEEVEEWFMDQPDAFVDEDVRERKIQKLVDAVEEEFKDLNVIAVSLDCETIYR